MLSQLVSMLLYCKQRNYQRACISGNKNKSWADDNGSDDAFLGCFLLVAYQRSASIGLSSVEVEMIITHKHHGSTDRVSDDVRNLEREINN